MSATREERIFLVAGIVAGFVGMGLGIAHGGFG
jgi:ABC-type lipoprotein release transport system permease subunit